MFICKQIHPADFKMLQSWGFEIPISAVPWESTFICELGDGTPLAAISLYMTNSKGASFAEGLCGNPEFKGTAIRQQAVNHIIKFSEEFLKSKGYTASGGITTHASLLNRYEKLGYKKVLAGAYAFIKEL